MHDPFASLVDLNRPLTVGFVGECMIELSDLEAPDGRVAMGVAGDTLNGAIYTARACTDLPVRVDYVTALGVDQLSDRIVKAIEAEGVGTRSIVRLDDKLPGIYAIELDEAGERSFRYWRAQSAARSMLDKGGLDVAKLHDFDVVCLSAISLAILPDQARSALISQCVQMKADGKVVVFDSNYRPALWRDADEARSVIDSMWAATSVALPSRDDEAKLRPDEDVEALLNRLALLGVPEIALKDGAGGPWLWSGARLPKDTYHPAAHVVDTTSAGDSFNAGYLAARLNQYTPVDAAQAGHRLARAVIGVKGAIIPQVQQPALF